MTFKRLISNNQLIVSQIIKRNSSATSQWTPPPKSKQDDNVNFVMKWGNRATVLMLGLVSIVLFCEINEFISQQRGEKKTILDRLFFDYFKEAPLIQNDNWLEKKAKENEVLLKAREEGKQLQKDILDLQGCNPLEKKKQKEFIFPRSLQNYSRSNQEVGFEYDLSSINYRQTSLQKVQDLARRYREKHDIE